jgi:peroxiredoxin
MLRFFMLRWLFLVFLALPALAQNQATPTFTLKDLQGNTTTLEAYKGKTVVLNFWATWCGPCTHEMPMLAETATRFADKNVVLVGVSIDDEQTQDRIQPFVKKRKIEFPILLGAKPELLDTFGLGVAVPATAIIASDGSIPFRVLGEIKKKELTERLDWLLSDRQSPAPKALVNNLK